MTRQKVFISICKWPSDNFVVFSQYCHKDTWVLGTCGTFLKWPQKEGSSYEHGYLSYFTVKTYFGHHAWRAYSTIYSVWSPNVPKYPRSKCPHFKNLSAKVKNQIAPKYVFIRLWQYLFLLISQWNKNFFQLCLKYIIQFVPQNSQAITNTSIFLFVQLI